MPACAQILPPYNAWLTSAYGLLAPVVEHPRLTDSVEWIESEGGKPQRHVTSKQIERGGFTFSVAYYSGIDVAILFTLAAITPGLPWSRRARIAALGLPPLFLIHLLGLVMSIRRAYADPAVKLLHGQDLGSPFFQKLTATLHSLLMSEVSLVVPFVIWGGLALWERARLSKAGTAPVAAGSRK